MDKSKYNTKNYKILTENIGKSIYSLKKGEHF